MVSRTLRRKNVVKSPEVEITGLAMDTKGKLLIYLHTPTVGKGAEYQSSKSKRRGPNWEGPVGSRAKKTKRGE